jgi:hypothetical protein
VPPFAQAARAAPVEPSAHGAFSRTRRVVAALLIVVSCVLAPLSVTTIWLRNRVLSTDRYVETVTPLASNAVIQKTVADNIVTELFARVNVQALAKAALPKSAEFLAAPLSAGVEQYARTAATSFMASDTFRQLWRAANERAHEQVRAALTGGGKAISTRGGKVVLDLSVVALKVRAELQRRGIHLFDSIPIAQVAPKYELFDSRQLRQAQRGVRVLDDLSWLTPALMFVCLGSGLLLSSNRRRTLIRWGVGVALAAAVVGAALAVGRSVYLDAVTGPQLPRPTAAAVFDTLLRFLRTGLEVVVTLGLIVAVATWITGTSNVATRLRIAARNAVDRAGTAAGEDGIGFGVIGDAIARHRAGVRIAGTLGTLVALAVWHHPRVRTALGLTLTLVVFLALVEFVARAAAADERDGFSTTGP